MKCETLDVWKKSARLSADVYKAFAECKDFGFKDQIRFLDISKGSTAEFATQTYIAMDIGYVDKAVGKEWIKTADSLLAMLTKLQLVKQEKL